MASPHLATKLRFHHLRLIVAVQQAGSLRRAADLMHLTQSALSKALGELETAIGARLYERQRGRLRITPAGEALLQAAKLMLGELEQVQADVRAIAAGERPTIRIGATPFLAQTLVPEALAELGRQHRAFRIELSEGPVPLLVSLLREGRLDAVLATWAPAATGEAAERLHVDTLRAESLLVIAHPRSPLAMLESVRWHELAQERWILPGRSSLVRQTVDSAFVAQGLRPPAPCIESMSPATNASLVARGLGVAALPGTISSAAERQGSVKRLAVVPAIPLPAVTLVHRAPGSEKIEALRAATRAAVERAAPSREDVVPSGRPRTGRAD